MWTCRLFSHAISDTLKVACLLVNRRGYGPQWTKMLVAKKRDVCRLFDRVGERTGGLPSLLTESQGVSKKGLKKFLEEHL